MENRCGAGTRSTTGLPEDPPAHWPLLGFFCRSCAPTSPPHPFTSERTAGARGDAEMGPGPFTLFLLSPLFVTKKCPDMRMQPQVCALFPDSAGLERNTSTAASERAGFVLSWAASSRQLPCPGTTSLGENQPSSQP